MQMSNIIDIPWAMWSFIEAGVKINICVSLFARREGKCYFKKGRLIIFMVHKEIEGYLISKLQKLCDLEYLY